MLVKNNYKILVVDDIPSIHQDFKKILTPAQHSNYQKLNEMEQLLETKSNEKNTLPSFELEFASQSNEAINLVKKALLTNAPFAVAFIDVQMPPGDDGIETISRIWEMDNEIQTIICTAFAKYTWEDIRAKLGDTDRLFFLKKPFDSIEIIQLACSLCKKWNINHMHRLESHAQYTSSAPSTSTDTMSRLNDAMNILSKLNNKLKENQND